MTEDTEQVGDTKIEEIKEQKVETIISLSKEDNKNIEGKKDSSDEVIDNVEDKKESKIKEEVDKEGIINSMLDNKDETKEELKQNPSSDRDEKTEDTKTNDKKTYSDKDNVIFVGIKPFMNYVTGVVMQFQNKGQDEVIVSARGKFISKAVDVVEVARRTFLKDENIKIDDIKISSEQFENKEGRRIYVSAIELKLVKI